MRSALVVALLLCARLAAADVRTYVIAIGNNAVPVGASEAGVSPLRYADDDAAAFDELAATFAQDVTLLSVLDADSQVRFPGAAKRARPPTLTELRATVARYGRQFVEDRRNGHDAELIFFFSGHGIRGAEGAAGLALLDGLLTRQILYDDVLAQLPARFVHIFVDACHAEAVVRPRDGSADVVDVSAMETQTWLAQETLARFPNVGAVIATAADQQAHEWDVYQGGIFTHEVLSALRGGADVNGDGEIEYTELQAFLSAANREVADPRARLDVKVRTPPIDLHVPIVSLQRMKGVGWGTQRAGAHRVYIENVRGERLIDVHSEAGHALRLALPADTTLFVRTAEGEADLHVSARREIDLDRLRFRPAGMVARGAMSSAMQRGLFVASFGPLYYRGFVDRNGQVSVSFVERPATTTLRLRRPAQIMLGAGAVIGIAGVVTGGLALAAYEDWERTSVQAKAADARDRYSAFRTAAIATLSIGGAVTLAGIVLFSLHR